MVILIKFLDGKQYSIYYFILAILVVVLSLFTLQETLKKEKKVTIDFKNIFIIYSNIIKDR